VLIGGLEQAEDAGTLEVALNTPPFKVATNGAGDAIFIHLANVFEEVAGLSASVVPILKELLKYRFMGSKASRPSEPVEPSH